MTGRRAMSESPNTLAEVSSSASSPQPVSRCPVVAFDHQSPRHSADTVASFRSVRETTPVAWTNAHGGYWVMSSYEALFEAARDDDIFSSRRMEQYGGPGLSVVIPKIPTSLHIPIELDPPEFRAYRKVINQITAPAAVARLQSIIVYYVTSFIDDIIEAGTADLTSVIGVPAAITIDWFGLPIGDWPRYASAHKALLAELPESPEYIRATTIDLPWISEQIDLAIAERRIQPYDDAISALMAAEVNGAPIRTEDVHSIVDLLIAGGVATTASLIGQALVWLAENPRARQDLIENPHRVDVAMEEFLRFFSPVQTNARTAVTSVEFHGCPVNEGDRVLLPWASANRDVRQFENPDTLDIERWPNRHVAFGVGIHRCAGSHVARAMAKEVITQVLERMPDYTVDTANCVRYSHQGVNSGWSRIPAQFTPGARRGLPYPTEPIRLPRDKYDHSVRATRRRESHPDRIRPGGR